MATWIAVSLSAVRRSDDYDKLNRLTKKDYPTGTDTTYAYDALGRRTQMVDSTGTTTWAYDVLGRVTSVTQPCGATSKTIDYTWDAIGNRASMTIAGLGTTAYVWDAANHLVQMTNPWTQVTSFQRDALGHLTRQDNANGTYSTWAYDLAGQIATVETKKADGTVVLSMSYTRDNIGNPTQIAEQLLDIDNTTLHTATIDYTYDAADRLTSEKRTGYAPIWYEYAMDAAGNRLSLMQKDPAGDVTGMTTGTYDSANKLQSYGNTSYTWDLNGNQTAKTTNGVIQTMVWDYENKMVQLHDGANLTFSYSADGLRRSKTVNGTTARFLYDGVRLIAETDDAGNFTCYYDLALMGREWYPLIAQTDNPAAQNTATHTFAFDALGTTRALTASDGAVSATFTDDAWGNVLAVTDANATAYQYVGKYGYYADGETGLELLTQRYFDEGTGEFDSRDPAMTDHNWFAYAAVNPGVRIDPSGTKSKSWCVMWPNSDWCGDCKVKKGASWKCELINSWYMPASGITVCTWSCTRERESLCNAVFICCPGKFLQFKWYTTSCSSEKEVLSTTAEAGTWTGNGSTTCQSALPSPSSP